MWGFVYHCLVICHISFFFRPLYCLLLTFSDNPLFIFKLFFYLRFLVGLPCCSSIFGFLCSFFFVEYRLSCNLFDNYIVCSYSIYCFWLPLWYFKYFLSHGLGRTCKYGGIFNIFYQNGWEGHANMAVFSIFSITWVGKDMQIWRYFQYFLSHGLGRIHENMAVFSIFSITWIGKDMKIWRECLCVIRIKRSNNTIPNKCEQKH